MEKLSVGACVRAGWEVLKKRPVMVIGAFVLAMLVSGISSALLDTTDQTPSAATTLMNIASGIIGIFVELGLVTFFLRAYDNVEAVKISDLWNPGVFLRYLGGQIVV